MVRPSAIALALALAVMVLSAAACSKGGQSTADQQRSIASQAGLPADVADFFALAAKGSNASYTDTIQTAAADGSPLQVTTTQNPPQRRVDVFHADGSIDSTIVTQGVSYQCSKLSGAWKCGRLSLAPTTGGVLSDDTVRSAIDQFKQRAADYDFKVEPRTVAGVQVRCLVTTRKPAKASDATLGGAGTLCLSDGGVPLLIDVPTGSLTAASYSTTVDPSVFNLPAPPDQTASSPPASS